MKPPVSHKHNSLHNDIFFKKKKKDICKFPWLLLAISLIFCIFKLGLYDKTVAVCTDDRHFINNNKKIIQEFHLNANRNENT